MNAYTSLPASSEAMAGLSWGQAELYYIELGTAPLSKDTLPAWLTQWSQLCDLLEETQMRLWIECMQDTTSPGRAERRRQFADNIGVRAAAYDRELERRLAECGVRPDGLAIPLRNIGVRAHQPESQDRLDAEERLTERYQALHANRAVGQTGAELVISSLESARAGAPGRT